MHHYFFWHLPIIVLYVFFTNPTHYIKLNWRWLRHMLVTWAQKELQCEPFFSNVWCVPEMWHSSVQFCLVSVNKQSITARIFFSSLHFNYLLIWDTFAPINKHTLHYFINISSLMFIVLIESRIKTVFSRPFKSSFVNWNKAEIKYKNEMNNWNWLNTSNKILLKL